ncbi:hypothetical protein MKHDV_01713 [Halodesulfovibrio sp. MK-HDV]|nr:hypothetical protein MKHDV_01713 [Halodesulfovibrio sp. MK-HDV]
MKAGLYNVVLALFLLLFPVAALQAQAKLVEYNLTIAQQKVSITGTPIESVTVNGQIPGPTLHFTEAILREFTFITQWILPLPSIGMACLFPLIWTGCHM